MNQIYQKLLNFPAMAKQKPALIKSQKSWLNYRETQCNYVEALYAGTIYSSVSSGDCVNDITRDRFNQLKDLWNQWNKNREDSF